LYLQNFCRFGDRHSRYGSRHVKQRPFIKRGHEFAAESLVRKNCDQKNDEGAAKSEPTVTENEVGDWLIGPDQKSVYRVFLFGRDFPANEQCHQHRHERDAEKRREEHRERFCEGERPEEPAFLRGQREDWDKAYGDYEQREEKRASHTLCAGDDYLDTFDVVRLALMCLPKVLKLLMRVLDHDDCRIDHGADGDRDAA